MSLAKVAVGGFSSSSSLYPSEESDGEASAREPLAARRGAAVYRDFPADLRGYTRADLAELVARLRSLAAPRARGPAPML